MAEEALVSGMRIKKAIRKEYVPKQRLLVKGTASQNDVQKSGVNRGTAHENAIDGQRN